MAVSFTSINTGLPKDIIEKMVEAESAPIKNMEARKAEVNEKKKLVTHILEETAKLANSKLEGTTKGFRDLKTVASKEGIVDLQIDKAKAEPGDHQIEVVQMAGKNSALSNGFPDSDETEVGVGFISFTLPNGEEKELFIDSQPNTLTNIAKQINEHTKEFGMRASVVNDGSGVENPWHLILSGAEQGTNSKVTWPEFYFLDGDMDLYVEQERGSQNAIVKVDGFEVQFPTNKIDNLIPGVSIQILEAQPGKEINISVTEDIKEISVKVNDLVAQVNSVLGFIKQQNTIDGNSDTFKTLAGDSSLQSLEMRLRSLLLKTFPVGEADEEGRRKSMRISDIGIQFEKSGLISLKEDKFKESLSRNFKDISDLFVGDGFKTGLIPELKQVAQMYTQGPNSILKMREMGFQKKVKDIDEQISRKQAQVEKTEVRLKETFAGLETTMAKLKSQQNYLTSSLGSTSLMSNLGG